MQLLDPLVREGDCADSLNSTTFIAEGQRDNIFRRAPAYPTASYEQGFQEREGKLLTCVAIIGLLSRQVAHPTRCKQVSKVRSWDRFVHTGAKAEGFCSLRWCVQSTPHIATDKHVCRHLGCQHRTSSWIEPLTLHRQPLSPLRTPTKA